jgi:hypothetical protein
MWDTHCWRLPPCCNISLVHQLNSLVDKWHQAEHCLSLQHNSELMVHWHAAPAAYSCRHGNLHAPILISCIKPLFQLKWKNWAASFRQKLLQGGFLLLSRNIIHQLLPLTLAWLQYFWCGHMHLFQKQSFGKHLQNNPTSSPLLQLQVFPQNEFLEITT